VPSWNVCPTRLGTTPEFRGLTRHGPGWARSGLFRVLRAGAPKLGMARYGDDQSSYLLSLCQILMCDLGYVWTLSCNRCG
jgi:hypothetical protein